MSNSPRAHGLYSPWNSPGQNTGVGSLSLLQGIFPAQGSNPGLPHCREILYQMSHKGSPRILEWVVYLFFSGSSRPRNQIRVSYIAGRFFTNWAIREAPKMILVIRNNVKSFAKLEVYTEVIQGVTTLYKNERGHSLVVQWLGPVQGHESIPGEGIKILPCGEAKRKK